jgi:hypothetical protein
MKRLSQHRAHELFWQTWARLGFNPARDERGDVPGWVMIVVMTAGLVLALTTIAGGRLQAMLESALASVSG